jgi:hypothetical protein
MGNGEHAGIRSRVMRPNCCKKLNECSALLLTALLIASDRWREFTSYFVTNPREVPNLATVCALSEANFTTFVCLNAFLII